eukprot:scaffold279477_cov15-Tisochrysis_lutea.AAC.1
MSTPLYHTGTPPRPSNTISPVQQHRRVSKFTTFITRSSRQGHGGGVEWQWLCWYIDVTGGMVFGRGVLVCRYDGDMDRPLSASQGAVHVLFLVLTLNPTFPPAKLPLQAGAAMSPPPSLSCCMTAPCASTPTAPGSAQGRRATATGHQQHRAQHKNAIPRCVRSLHDMTLLRSAFSLITDSLLSGSARECHATATEHRQHQALHKMSFQGVCGLSAISVPQGLQPPSLQHPTPPARSGAWSCVPCTGCLCAPEIAAAYLATPDASSTE